MATMALLLNKTQRCPETDQAPDVAEVRGARDAGDVRPLAPVRNLSDSLARLMREPFTGVREKLLMTGAVAPELLDDAMAEFKKFFGLIARGHRGIGMISPAVDEVWHCTILHTEFYAKLCDDVFGRFIHHRPATPSSPIGREPRERFLEAYRQVYGDLPAIWGDGAQCFSTCDTPSTNCQDPSCK
jgi:hypothetical protein